MMKLTTFILLLAMVFLSSQTTDRYTSTVGFPYQGMPMWIQVRDTDQLEISYIFYDKSTGRTIVRGNLGEGLRELNKVYDSTIVPAQEMNYAASRVRQYLNSNGTVRRRDSLTWAIRYYDSLKVKYGYNF
jgi:hypothetical protein